MSQVNFNMDDFLAEDETEEDGERPSYLLESDNAAWARGKPQNIPPPGLQKPMRSSGRSRVVQAEVSSIHGFYLDIITHVSTL